LSVERGDCQLSGAIVGCTRSPGWATAPASRTATPGTTSTSVRAAWAQLPRSTDKRPAQLTIVQRSTPPPPPGGLDDVLMHGGGGGRSAAGARAGVCRRARLRDRASHGGLRAWRVQRPFCAAAAAQPTNAPLNRQTPRSTDKRSLCRASPGGWRGVLADGSVCAVIDGHVPRCWSCPRAMPGSTATI
jgi:hypothetical protein